MFGSNCLGRLPFAVSGDAWKGLLGVDLLPFVTHEVEVNPAGAATKGAAKSNRGVWP